MSDPNSRLPASGALLVLLAAVLAQSWVLGLSFQLDDYTLLGDPAELFERGRGSFMLRWPAWALWSAQRALGPASPAPVPHHAVALLLHGLTAALLAAAVARLTARPVAGLLAGLVFGVGAGGIQAVSWTSAQPDLLAALFSVGALAAFLRARERGGPWRWLAPLLALLAALSKAPALAALPALALLLAAARPAGGAHSAAAPRSARATLRRELASLALVAAAALALRALYTGSALPRYGAEETPGLADLPGVAAGALLALGQALHPWNRDPLLLGEEPWLVGGLGLRALLADVETGLLLVGLPVALVGLAVRRARRPLLLAGVLAWLLALPAGAIHLERGTNVISRATYLPLLAASAAVALAVVHASERRRAAGLLLAGFLAALLLDARAHVARTERLADEERRAWTGLVERTWTGHAADPAAAPLEVHALVADAGFAGIPGLGRLLPFAFRPPFDPPREPPLVVRAHADEDALERALGAAPFGERALAILAPPPTVLPPITGAERRRLRRPALWGPGGTWLDAKSVVRRSAVLEPPRAEVDPGWDRLAADRWRAVEPLPEHRVPALRLEVGPGAAGVGTLELGEAEPFAVSLPAGDGPRTLVVAPPRDLDRLLGPAFEELAWDGPAPLVAAPLVLPRLPSLGAVAPEANAALRLAVGGPAPRFAVSAPSVAPAPWTRLELVLLPDSEAVALFADAPTRGGELLELRPALLHGDPARSPGPPSPDDAPWDAFVERWLAPGLRRHGLGEAELAWRVTLHHEGGALAAASPLRRARLVLADDAP